MAPYFTASSLLLLLLLNLGLAVVRAEPQPNAEPVVVDRLVSRHYYEDSDRSLFRRSFDALSERFLQKRGSGYANGGDASNSGKDKSGKPKNKRNYEISFYHLNDVHAHLDEFRSSGSSCTDPSRGCVGGYPRVKAVLQKQRPTKKNSLLLNAGDEFQGTLFYTLYKGAAISSVLNHIGFDAFTLGNHEFDDGDDLLANFLANLTFPTLSSNVKTTHRKLAKQLVPFKVWDKHQLAILALTTETTKFISAPGAGTTFEDPVEAAKRTVKLINRYHPHVKRIVALTHIGYSKDIELAQKTTGISLIVGGHSHTLLGDNATIPNAVGPYPTIVKNAAREEVFVVTSFRWGEYLGYIDVEYDSKGRIVRYEGAPIHLTNTDNSTKAEEPKLKAEVKKWAEGFIPFGRTIVGYTEFPLVQDTCQFGECTLGDLIGDVLAALSPSNTTSPIGNHTAPPSDSTFAGGIMNAGGIRAMIEGPGNISLQQVLETFPFGNAVTELTFTGRELWRIFEGIGSRVSLDNGIPVTSFVQISSSIRVSYDTTKPVGQKLISLSVANGDVIGGENGENSSKKYIIATIDYLATGGDNFWPAKGTGDFVTLETIDQTVINYFKAIGVGQEGGVGRVAVQLDGRIAITGL